MAELMEICQAKRDEVMFDGGIKFHLRCELYKHNKGKHKCTLMPGIIILFDTKE